MGDSSLSALFLSGCSLPEADVTVAEDTQATDTETESETENPGVTVENVLAAPETQGEDFEIKSISSSTCAISGYTGTDEIVVIPEEINGQSVILVSEYAFNGSSARAVRLADSITELSDWAFQGNEDIEIVICREGLETIGQYCFFGCTELHTLILNNSLTELRYEAVSQCPSLSVLEIPVGVSVFEESCIDTYGMPDDFYLVVASSSWAERYAISNNIPYIYTYEYTAN